MYIRYKCFSEKIVHFNKQYYVFEILLKFIWYVFIRIFTQCALFSFHTAWLHSIRAVQQVAAIIVTQIDNKAPIMKNKLKMRCKKVFFYLNISSGMFFFERNCNGTCANNNSYRAYVHYCVKTPTQLWDISRKRRSIYQYLKPLTGTDNGEKM